MFCVNQKCKNACRQRISTPFNMNSDLPPFAPPVQCRVLFSQGARGGASGPGLKEKAQHGTLRWLGRAGLQKDLGQKIA